MTGDQWYNVIRLALCLGLLAFVLFGVYRLMVRTIKDDRSNDDNGT